MTLTSPNFSRDPGDLVLQLAGLAPLEIHFMILGPHAPGFTSVQTPQLLPNADLFVRPLDTLYPTLVS